MPGRGESPATFGPAVVVANHYDDFPTPRRRSAFSTNVNLAALPDEIRALARDVSVAALEPLTRVSG